LIYPTTFFEIPLLRDSRKSPRLQFLDTGLLNFGVGLQKEILGTKDLNSVYQGTMIEHLVGQELIAHKSTPLEKLNFWVRDKNSSDAELDFVYPYEGKAVPIEVKSGSSGRLRSLLNFLDESRLNYAIRFFAGELSLNEIKTPKGKTIHLLNLPYFLAGQTEKYIEWLINNLPKETNNQLVNEPRAEYKKEKKAEKIVTKIEELTSRHLKLLKHCQNEPKKGKELLEEALGLNYQSRNKRIFINPLFDLELIEWTNKSNPKDKQQAYQLTEKGRALIE
jgi:predicted transcriptional regulator